MVDWGAGAMSPLEIARDVRRRIGAGEFVRGGPLPAASGLAQDYGVSLEEMIEALALLAAGSEDPELAELIAERDRLIRELTALRAALADESILWATRPEESERPGRAATGAAEPAAVAGFEALHAVASVAFGPSEAGPGPIQRTSFTKSWTGGLVGISEGVVLSASAQQGVGSISFEVFTGSLGGMEGSIALRQYEIDRDGDRVQVCESVPKSGTGGLADVVVVIDLAVVGDEQHATVVYRPAAGTSGARRS